MTEQLEVAQADRDAAADRLESTIPEKFRNLHPATHTAKAIRKGKMDGHPWVQNYARHRILAIQATEARMAAAVEAERERILVIVADQKKAANESDKWPKYHGMAGSYMQGAYVNACANIEAAIRSADDGQG